MHQACYPHVGGERGCDTGRRVEGGGQTQEDGESKHAIFVHLFLSSVGPRGFGGWRFVILRPRMVYIFHVR